MIYLYQLSQSINDTMGRVKQGDRKHTGNIALENRLLTSPLGSFSLCYTLDQCYPTI